MRNLFLEFILYTILSAQVMLIYIICALLASHWLIKSIDASSVRGIADRKNNHPIDTDP